VAEIALAFRMNVIVSTAHPEKYKDADPRIRFASLDELFSESDVITLHCPMTKDTEGIIRKENISLMKDGVILINVSRGGLVVEQDLADALIEGKVAGAAADVVTAEPMLEDNPLLTAPNMVITPHIAWASVEARMRLIDTVAANVRGFLEGNPVNVVSK
jgi:glycerate dehydrogenase